MFSWFKKQIPVEPKKPKTGLLDLPAMKSKKIDLSKVFQRTVESLKPVDAKGNAIEGFKGFATDSGDNYSSFGVQNSYIANISGVQLAWYASQSFVGWQACAIIAQNWLVDKACTMPGKDACRHGYEITANNGKEIEPKVLDFIRQRDKHYKIKQNCVEFVRKGRVFGIRVAMFHVDSKDPDYYTKPFNIDGVKPGTYRGISQIDPIWITPELDMEGASNPASLHFYEPTWWRINAQRVHRSHLVIFKTGEMPDVLKPTYLYGGLPIPQKIAERVYAAERTANEAPMLSMTKRLTTLKMDTTKVVADSEEFAAQMQFWTELQNNYGVKIIGGDEEITQFDTSLADLDAVIMTQYQIVAAAAGVPATKLLGTSPKGFNATGEFEEASYHEELESIQEHDLSPLVERHHELLIKSEVAPQFNIAPFTTDVNWHPVDSPTAAELADINLKKAQTDSAQVANGAIDGEDIRARLIADKDSGYNGMELEVDRELEIDEETASESPGK